MPYGCHKGVTDGFVGVEIVDITSEFLNLRYHKSSWEIEQIRAAFQLADLSYEAMKEMIKVGNTEIQVAAAGEYAARAAARRASGFRRLSAAANAEMRSFRLPRQK